MKNIAIFYHTYFSGGSPPTSFDTALRITCEQLDTLNFTGLREAAQPIFIGVSGSEADYAAVRCTIPWSGINVFHNKTGVGELPTMAVMQDWCKTHPGYAVLYFHTKGAIHHGNPTAECWRRCMERVVLHGWVQCVADLLERGFESVGAHWLKPHNYPIIGPVPYWGGNFFWATSNYLNTLPLIDIHADRYQAEVWIGKAGRVPRVRDYAPHWPGAACYR